MYIKKYCLVMLGILQLASTGLNAFTYTAIMDDDLRGKLPNGSGRYSINLKPNNGICGYEYSGHRVYGDWSKYPMTRICHENSVWFGAPQGYQTVFKFDGYIDDLKYEEIDDQTKQVTQCKIVPPTGSGYALHGDAHIRFAKGCKVRVWDYKHNRNKMVNWVSQ